MRPHSEEGKIKWSLVASIYQTCGYFDELGPHVIVASDPSVGQSQVHDGIVAEPLAGEAGVNFLSCGLLMPVYYSNPEGCL